MTFEVPSCVQEDEELSLGAEVLSMGAVAKVQGADVVLCERWCRCFGLVRKESALLAGVQLVVCMSAKAGA